MIIYYFNEKGNVRVHLFNGIQEFKDRYYSGELDDMKNSINYAAIAGALKTDTLYDFKELPEVLEKMVLSDANDGTDIKPSSYFRSEDFWKHKLVSELLKNPRISEKDAGEIAEDIMPMLNLLDEDVDVLDEVAARVEEYFKEEKIC